MSEGAPTRLKIAIIGAGRVGAVIGAAWQRAGHRIIGVTARSDTSRLRADALLPGVPVLSAREAATSADLVFIAVPDRVLPELVNELANDGVLGRGQFIVHPAGCYGLAVLQPAVDRGAVGLALHPAFPLTGTSVDLDRLAGAAFGVTAQDDMRSVAEALVVELGGEPVWVPEHARLAYHAAVTFAANYAMTLVNESVALLSQSGAEDPQRILGPLVRASVETALERGHHGQTGPITRGDATTVAAHVGVLADRAPTAEQAYRALGRLTVERLRGSAVIDDEAADAVLRVLGEAP